MMRMPSLSFFTLGASLALTIALAVNPAAAQTKKVKLAYGVTVVDSSTAPWLSAAKTGGFWQEEGLDVEVTGFNGAGPALQLLSRGQVDVVFTGTPEMFHMRGEGIPIKAIANAYDKNHNYPVVPADSAIMTIKDFKGKRVGVQTMTGSIVMWMDTFLGAHGMTKKDLGEIIPVGTGATAVHALTSNQIDVLIEWHGHYALLESQFGLKFRKFNNEPSLTNAAFVQDFFARDETIKNDPKMLIGVLRGVAKGILFARTNPAAAARGHFDQFPSTKPTNLPLEEAVKKAGEVIEENVELSEDSSKAQRWGYVEQAKIDRLRDLLADSGVIHKKLEWTEYYTPQFIDEVNKFDPAVVIAKAKSMK